MLEADCEGAVSKLIKQVVLPGNLGMPAMLRDECCPGGTRWSAMAPEFLINGRQSSAGTCVSPRMLGFVPYERVVCEGRTVTEYRWFSLDKWQQAEVPDVIEADVLEIKPGQTQNVWLGAWRTETCPSGGSVKQLVKMNYQQARRVLGLGMNQTLPAPVLIYQQVSLLNGAVFQPGITYYPALPTPGGSILSQPISYNLNTIPEYDPDVHRGVILLIHLMAGTMTQSYDLVIEFGGIEYARATVIGLGGAWAADANYNHPTVRIPTGGILAGNLYYQLSAPGNAAGMVARVFVVGFV